MGLLIEFLWFGVRQSQMYMFLPDQTHCVLVGHCDFFTLKRENVFTELFSSVDRCTVAGLKTFTLHLAVL
jgi:hypothetical protein